MTAGSRHKLTAIAFLLIIASFSLGTLYTLGEKVRDQLLSKPSCAGKVHITPYPAEALRQRSLIEHVQSTHPTLLMKLTTARTTVEEQVTNRFPLRNTFVDIYGLCQLTMGKQYIDDAEVGKIFKDPRSNHLYPADSFTYTPESLHHVQQSLLGLKQTLAKSHIPLLFVMAPNKLIDLNDPAGQMADRFLAFTAQQQIDSLDMRQALQITEANKERIYYKTDHHWTVQHAFHAYTKIFARLKQDYHFAFDDANADINNFVEKTFPNKFLGSYGRKVGRFYAGKEDITLLMPKFPTAYTSWKLNLRNQQETRDGDFAEVIFDGKDLDKIAIDYIIYLNGDWPGMKITNKKQDKYKLLVIKDSFAPPVIAFLSLNVREIDILDLRQYCYKQSVEEYILDSKPDLVLIMYCPKMLTPETFAFSE